MAEERSSAEKRAQSREPGTGPPANSSWTESPEDQGLLADRVSHDPNMSFEAFPATFLKKILQKELHHSNNPSELQGLIDDSKRVEWETLQDEKQAIVVIPPHEAALIRKHKPDRIMSSRLSLQRNKRTRPQGSNPGGVCEVTMIQISLKRF